MINSIVNAPVLIQPSINALKEPFCKDMIEASTKLSPEPSRDPATTMVASTLLPLFYPSGLTDRELLKLCQQYGGNSRAWKRKFEELLPEVLKRHLYKGRKITSIYEFAAKLCGLSKDSVDNVIRVYGQLEDKPILRSLVVEFGWSKLRIVAGIATPETDASWAEKVRVLPKDSLEVFVRDLKRQEEREKIEKLMNNKSQQDIVDLSRDHSTTTSQLQLTDQKVELNNREATCPIFPRENLPSSHNMARFDHSNSQKTEPNNKNTTSPIFRTENLTQTNLVAHFDHPNLLTPFTNHHENPWPTIPFKLSPETDFRLRKLKVRIEKGKKEKISFNQLFETMLDIIENKEKITKKSRNPYGMTPLKLRRM